MPNTQNRIRNSFQEASYSTREIVQEHPVSTSLTVFGMGLGLGVVLAQLLSDEQLRQQHGLAHKLGRQMLDSMSRAVPESLRTGR